MDTVQAAALQPHSNHPVPSFQTVSRVVSEGLHRITEPIKHLAEAIHGRLEAPNGGPEVGSSEGVAGEESMGGIETGSFSLGGQADRMDEVASGTERTVDTGQSL
jgi:hypothetical protein